MIIAVAGGAYFFAFASPGSSGAKTTSTSTTVHTTSAKSVTSTTSMGLTYYTGSFNYSLATGPSGVRSFPNGTAQYYNSTEVGSGTFKFFIAAANYSGSGTGQGTITITTQGFCAGSQTIHYTFLVPDATTILDGNITVFFSGEVPANYTVPLTCTGSMASAYTANNPWPYLPEYPGEFSIPLASVPTSEIFHGTPSASFTWGFSITESS